MKTQMIVLQFMMLLFVFGSFAKADNIQIGELQERAYFEQFVNPGMTQQPTQKTLQLIDIPHFEIPKRLLVSHSIDGVDTKLIDALEFNRNGEVWVRWIPSLGDTTYIKKVEKFLRDAGLPSDQKKRFKGYKTASRSLFVVDPMTGYIFSSKASTDSTSGAWSHKPYPVIKALRTLLVSDYVNSLQKKHPELFKNLGIQLDTHMYGIPGIDEATSFREIKGRPQGRKLIPLFSFADENFGREFARANSTQVELTPVEGYLRLVLGPWAHQVGRFIGITGIASNSQHGQNSLIEVDEKLRPTGYVELRDTADARVLSAIVEAHESKDFLKEWVASTRHLGEAFTTNQKTVDINLAPLHGLVPPNWIFEHPMSKILLGINPEGSFLNRADSPEISKTTRISTINLALYGAVYDGMAEIIGSESLIRNKSGVPHTFATIAQSSDKNDPRVSSPALKTFTITDPLLLKDKFKGNNKRTCKSIFQYK